MGKIAIRRSLRLLYRRSLNFRDLHAAILHLPGLSANDLTYRYAGRDHRLTGPDGGNGVGEWFA